MNPIEVSGADVAAGLREAGLKRSDGIFFQSAMSPFGQIAGGPAAVLDALYEVVGDEALVAMPAFPFQGSVLEYLRDDPCFRVRSTPSAMGAISERFRRLPGTARSLHPTHSVTARGPGAEALVAGHERAATPFGAGTPFAGMLDREMIQVWFGTGVHAFTLYHTFECLLGDRFPIDVFLPERYDVRCEDADGVELTVGTLVHDPEVASRRIRSQARQEVRRELVEHGILRVVPLGASELLVCRIPPMFELLDRLLERGLTIYDIDVEGSR
ncbi:MAG TPA: AAC(3) family N-acetyltransferase [Thermoleophilaceae bacterium]|nr:AAC(3) family N-acetyltransferase [Thermoleophilaceae bacterium]